MTIDEKRLACWIQPWHSTHGTFSAVHVHASEEEAFIATNIYTLHFGEKWSYDGYRLLVRGG